MRRNHRPARAFYVLLATTSLSACTGIPGVYVYESSGDGHAGAAAAFDSKSYVDGIWSRKVVPTVHDKAVDVTVVAAALADNPAAAGRQFGHRSGTGSPYSYLVKGAGTVTKVDRSAATGPVTVAVAAADGGKPVTLTVLTGPVIAGTSLRDAVGFIAFGDFTNQIDYAEVANQLNAKVKTDVVTTVDVAQLPGRKLTFHGAFSDLVPGQIVLVPTELQVVQ